ncbi:MAG: hypothetical protein H7315_04775 [Herminiimonas sp.]|nr:hypothetical protein [Herminiimonas sp.]
MDKKSHNSKPNFLTKLVNNYSGPLAPAMLSGVSAWMIVTGVKGLAGFTVNAQTAGADLVGILVIIGLARWMKVKFDTK